MFKEFLHLSLKHVPFEPDFTDGVWYEIPGKGYIVLWADPEDDRHWLYPIMQYLWNNNLHFILFSNTGEVDPQFEVFS